VTQARFHYKLAGRDRGAASGLGVVPVHEESDAGLRKRLDLADAAADRGAGVPVTVSTIQAQSEKKAPGSVMVILLP